MQAVERLREIEQTLRPQGVALNADSINMRGDINIVAFGRYQNTQIVAKLPRRVGFEMGTIAVEAGTLDHLASRQSLARHLGDITLPRLVSHNTSTTSGGPYSLVTYVAGEVLSAYDMQQLTIGEQRLLGQKLGTFIAAFAASLDTPTYNRLIRTSDPGHFDLLEVLRSRVSQAHEIAGRGFPSLAAASEEVLQDVLRFRQAGLLEPTIIGHDDLHEGNLTFEAEQGTWRLQGIFDFGGTKPTTPERELRHMQMIGCDDVVLAAKQAYETHTGIEPSQELIDFWAKIRLAVSSTGQLLRGRFGTKEPYLLDILPRYFPAHDWSELDHLRQPAAARSYP